MSDVDLSVLAGQRDDDDDPPILTPRPDSTEERQLSSPVLLHLGLEAETRPGDLSGESDGLQSPPGGGDWWRVVDIDLTVILITLVTHPAK